MSLGSRGVKRQREEEHTSSMKKVVVVPVFVTDGIKFDIVPHSTVYRAVGTSDFEIRIQADMGTDLVKALNSTVNPKFTVHALPKGYGGGVSSSLATELQQGFYVPNHCTWDAKTEVISLIVPQKGRNLPLSRQAGSWLRKEDFGEEEEDRPRPSFVANEILLRLCIETKDSKFVLMTPPFWVKSKVNTTEPVTEPKDKPEKPMSKSKPAVPESGLAAEPIGFSVEPRPAIASEKSLKPVPKSVRKPAEVISAAVEPASASQPMTSVAAVAPAVVAPAVVAPAVVAPAVVAPAVAAPAVAAPAVVAPAVVAPVVAAPASTADAIPSKQVQKRNDHHSDDQTTSWKKTSAAHAKKLEKIKSLAMRILREIQEER